METLPVCTEARAVPPCSESAQDRCDLQPEEIFVLLTQRREATDEELELIEMRYQQALALMNLHDLFAEAQFDCDPARLFD